MYSSVEPPKTFRCDKCNDTFKATFARISERTSCRKHCYVKYNKQLACRDCGKIKGQGSYNCYHISTPSRCCFQ